MAGNISREIQLIQEEQYGRVEPLRTYIKGIIVSYQGNIRVPGQPTKVYFKELNSEQSEPTPVVNDSVADVEGLPVIVGYDTTYRHEDRRIISQDMSAFSATINLTQTNSGPHATTHQYPAETLIGSDPVLVYQAAFMPLKSRGFIDNLTVQVFPLLYRKLGYRVYFPGQYVDLTSHVPADGSRYVMTGLDMNTNTIRVVDGEVSPQGVIPQYPRPQVDYIPSAYFRLTTGQTGIVTIEHYRDARMFINLDADAGEFVESGVTPDPGEIMLSAAGGWPSDVDGCQLPQKETYATNGVNLYVAWFDQTTTEYIEWSVWMPDDWDGGTLTAKFLWTANGGTGDVAWGLQGRGYANGNIIDGPFGTGQTASDTFTAGGDILETGLTTNITLGGNPGAGRFVHFRAYRDTANDDLSADAGLVAVKVYYGRTP